MASSTPIFSKISFFTLVGSASLTIPGSEGWKSLALLVDVNSTASATLTGSTDTIGGNVPTSVPIIAGTGLGYGQGDNDIDGITITAPSGCTVYITTSKTNSSNIISMVTAFASSGGGGVFTGTTFSDQNNILANQIFS